MVPVLASRRGADGRKEDLVDHRSNGTERFVPGPEYYKAAGADADYPRALFTGFAGSPRETCSASGVTRLRQFCDTDRGAPAQGVAIAALATGLAQGCVDECVRYAGQREAFCRPIRPATRRFQFTRGRHGGAGARGPAWHGTTPRPGLLAGQPVSRRSPRSPKLTASNAALDNTGRHPVCSAGGDGS